MRFASFTLTPAAAVALLLASTAQGQDRTTEAGEAAIAGA